MRHSSYMRDKAGTAVLEHDSQQVVAGSSVAFDLVYTAGFLGIDDSGSLKVATRFASDMAKPQLDNPAAPNYVSVEASNGATLDVRYDPKGSLRPWDKTLYIKVVKGFLSEGDKIVIRYGDRRSGSPGIRMQTFCEESYELKILVDPYATYHYIELPDSPTLKIVPGAPATWRSVLPTMRPTGRPFRFALKAEDIWGNPCDPGDDAILLKSNVCVKGLPEKVAFLNGQDTCVVDDLVVDEPGDVVIECYHAEDKLLSRSNPCRITASCRLLPYWGDLHGQSEETIGTNSVSDYFEFARDKAFLDVTCHQGNDFQITNSFWQELQRVTAAMNAPGRFVAFPGYEWSGNTCHGGDHNVIYLNEGQQIHRSSHALIDDLTDEETDRYTSQEMIDTLANKKDVFIYAHVGGRYADLNLGNYDLLPPAIEVHSAWGTFEWLLHDAFGQSLRPGIVANSDGHKGRPGASYPGASTFGSYGGLTCFLCQELTRESVFESLHQRRHYATTGARMLLDTSISIKGFERSVAMGQIITTSQQEAELHIEALCSSPVERIDIFNGAKHVETVKPFEPKELGNRLRVVWEGAECRGRSRETVWDGYCEISGNKIKETTPINFWNPEKPLTHGCSDRVGWQSMTTGGFCGFDAFLEKPDSGRITIETPLIKETLNLPEVGFDDVVFDAGGLGRRLRVFRLPETNKVHNVKLHRNIKISPHNDNPIYVRLTCEDGHMAWTSPIYLVA